MILKYLLVYALHVYYSDTIRRVTVKRSNVYLAMYSEMFRRLTVKRSIDINLAKVKRSTVA